MRNRRLLPVLFPLVVASLALGCSGQLSIEVSGKGEVAIAGAEEPLSCAEPLCTFEVPGDSELILTAKATEGSKFQSWTGDCIGEKPACTLTVDGKANARARFVKRHKVKLTIKGDGRVQSADGRLDCPSGPCEATYTQGEELRLRRQAGRDVFDAYSGSCTGSDCSLIVKEDLDITAVFTVPAGRPLRGAAFAAGDLKEPRVGAAVDEKGGFAVVSVAKRKAHLARYDAEGKELFSVTRKVGKTTYPPALAFFGDDLVLLTATDRGSLLTRIAPDGKTTRYSRYHKGCPSFTELVVARDAIFTAGSYGGGGSTCGEKELIASGEHDGVVARFAVEDGALTWVTQFGGNGDEVVSALAVNHVDDAFVGYTTKPRGGRILHLNPAGKAYPELPFGKSDETEVLDLKIPGPGKVNVMGHVYEVVDFGGTTLGVSAKDGAGRMVWVQIDEEGRHQKSKLVARSRCGEAWRCAYDMEGGFVRLPEPEEGKRRRRGGSISLPVTRLGDDGAERWSSRLKGSGFGRVSEVRMGPGNTVLLLGVLDGELDLGEKAGRLATKGPQAVFIQLKD